MIEPKTSIRPQRAVEIAANLVNETQLEGQLEPATPGQAGFTVTFEKAGPRGLVGANLVVRLRSVGCKSTVSVDVRLATQNHSVDDLSTLRALLYDLLVLGSFVQQALGNFDIMDPN